MLLTSQEYLSHWGDLQRFEQVHGHVEVSTTAMHSQRQGYIVEYYDTRIAHEVVELINSQPWDHDGGLRAQFVSEDPFQSEPPNDSRVHPSAPLYTLGSAAYRSPVNHTAGPQYDPPNHGSLSGVFSPSFPVRQPTGPSVPNRLFGHSQSSGTGATNPSLSLPEWQPAAGNRYFGNHDASDNLPNLASRVNEPAALQGLLDQMDWNARARQRSVLVNPAPVPTWGNRDSSNSRQAIPPENKVDPERILAGEDSRTSIMIKDVPVCFTLPDLT